MPLGTPAFTCQLLNGSAIGYLAHQRGQPLAEKLSATWPLSGCVNGAYSSPSGQPCYSSAKEKGSFPAKPSLQSQACGRSLVSKSPGSSIFQVQEQLGQIMQIGGSV